MSNPFTIPDDGHATTPEERAAARVKLKECLTRALKEAALLPEVAPLVLVQGCWHALRNYNVLHDRLPKVEQTPATGEYLIDARRGLHWSVDSMSGSAYLYGRDAYTLVIGLRSSLYNLPGDVLAMRNALEDMAGGKSQPIHYSGPFAGLPLDEP